MMSDLPEKLRDILPDLEHGKGTHEIWANCDQKYRDENPDIGDVNFHLANVKIYEQRIHLVTSAADLIELQQQRISELSVALNQSLIHWGATGVRDEDGIAYRECERILDLTTKDKEHE